MASLRSSLEGNSFQRSLKGPMPRAKRIYVACLSIFGVGVLLRIGLGQYWHAVRPHTIDIAAGNTYALVGRLGTVFVKPMEGHFLEMLDVLPVVFLLAGFLVWVKAPREWK